MATKIPDRIRDAARFMEGNSHKELDLEKLAQRFFISPYHCHRLFKAATNFTAADYIEQQRIIRAVYLLRYDKKPVADIARLCGWKHHSTMTRAFARVLKRTPSAVRSSRDKLIAPAKVPRRSLPGLSVRRALLPEIHAMELPGESKRVAPGRRWLRLLDKALAAGVMRGTPPRVIARYRSEKQGARSQYSLALEGEARPPFIPLTIPAGKYLLGEYTGNPQQLKDCYDILYARVLRHSLPLAPDLPFEIFERYPPFCPADRCRIMVALPLQK